MEKPVTLKELTKKAVNFSISLPQDVEGNVNIEIKTGNKVVENGSAKSYRLPAGEYTYTITHPNCETESGNFTVADDDVAIAVTMTRKLVFADVFDGIKGIEATNKSKGNGASDNTDYGFMPPKIDDDIVLISDNKGQKPSTAFGYESKSGTITVDSADINEKVELVKSETQDVHFAITKPEGITADAAVVVKQGNKTISAEANGAYKLPAGNYDYTVTCEGCEKENGSFMVKKEAKTVNVVLEKTLVFEDFFGQLKGRATVENDKATAFNAKKEKGEKYLQSTNVASGTTSKMTFDFNKATRMSFKYMVSESGSSYTGGDYGLKVTRNGKTVDHYEEISKNWGDYEVLAKQGDKITIEYKCYINEYAFNKEDENWIKVKDFKAEPLTK